MRKKTTLAATLFLLASIAQASELSAFKSPPSSVPKVFVVMAHEATPPSQYFIRPSRAGSTALLDPLGDVKFLYTKSAKWKAGDIIRIINSGSAGNVGWIETAGDIIDIDGNRFRSAPVIGPHGSIVAICRGPEGFIVLSIGNRM